MISSNEFQESALNFNQLQKQRTVTCSRLFLLKPTFKHILFSSKTEKCVLRLPFSSCSPWLVDMLSSKAKKGNELNF
jgi:hypothetical protein